MALRKTYIKVLRDSKGHFFKSVLLCGFGSEAPDCLHPKQKER